jgi:hypothetical protein
MDRDRNGYVLKAEYDWYAVRSPYTLKALANGMTSDEFFNYLVGKKHYFMIDEIRAHTLKQYPGPITE